MGRPVRPYSPTDVTRAVRAVEKAGVCVARVRFTADGFEVVAGKPEEQATADWFAGGPLYRNRAA